MAALKSAMRQPHAHVPSPPELLPNSSLPHQHDLRSRFSAETLMIRTPSQALRSIFSSSTSASSASPTSSFIANSTRRYHRRVSSSQAAKAARAGAGHQPTVSESYLDLTSPTFVGAERADIHSTRDDPDLSRSDSTPASRSRSQSRSRRPSFRRRTSSVGGHSTTAADKLAGAAKEVLDKLVNLRGGNSHSRQGSEASLEIRRRSISNPSIALAADRVTPESERLPRNRAQTAPEASASASVSASSSRSGTPSGSARRGRLPELAAARPRPKHLPVNSRPASPPSPSIPPLRPAPSASTKDRVQPRVQPFSAQATTVPRADVLNAYELNELFVRIDVGGQSTYTTTVATLLGSSDGGGKLGEFVESLLGDAAIKVDDNLHVRPESALESFGPSGPALRVELPLSPFPFADSASDLGHFVAFDEPASPIDPFAGTTASTLFGQSLFLPPPEMFGVSDKALTSAPSLGQKALFVPSPTSPSGFKHKSIHPDMVSQDTLCPDAPQLTPPSSVSSGSSSSFSIDLVAFESSSGDEATPSAKNRPFFTILRDQSARPDSCAHGPDSPIAGENSAMPAAFSARASLAFPQTISTRSVSSVCADAARAQPDLAPSTRPMHDVSACVGRSIQTSEKSSRASSRSAVRQATAAERTVSVFLDRTDLPLSPPHVSVPEVAASGSVPTYAAILAFIRASAFPPAVYPPLQPMVDQAPTRRTEYDYPAPLDVTRLVKEDPRIIFTCLGNFATLRAECAWLGLRAAERQALAQIELLECAAGGRVHRSNGRGAPSSAKPVRDGWI